MLIIFLVVFIGFSIWNTVNLHYLVRRPLRADALNDKNYWELKYKMQYMLTVFAVVIAIVSYLGYNSVTNIQDTIKKETAAKLDSARVALDTIEARQASVNQRLYSADSVIQTAQNAIIGLSDREKFINSSLSLRSGDLDKLRGRISEINAKNIIQQGIYIVDGASYKSPNDWQFQKFYFKDLITNTGQKLPSFKKPPFILPISNEGYSFTIAHVTNESFEVIANNASPTNAGDPIKTSLNITFFITVNP